MVACLADVIQLQAPERMRIKEAFAPPGRVHPFGADNLGRDVYSRVVHGSRISLGIGFATVVLTGLAGTVLGCVSGYFRRWDELLMRTMDALLAFPAILLAVAITAALGPLAVNAVIALTAVYTPRTARIARASVLVAREMEYVQAARAVGAGAGRVLAVHVLPNCLTPLIVQLTFVFAYAGAGRGGAVLPRHGPAASDADLGQRHCRGPRLPARAWWICLFPGPRSRSTVLGLNLLGDGLRGAAGSQPVWTAARQHAGPTRGVRHLAVPRPRIHLARLSGGGRRARVGDDD